MGSGKGKAKRVKNLATQKLVTDGKSTDELREMGFRFYDFDDGPSMDGYCILQTDGLWEWYFNGELHREDGPAYESWDNKWYQHGKLHREDGPAIIYKDGVEEWWINGKEVRANDHPFNKLKLQNQEKKLALSLDKNPTNF